MPCMPFLMEIVEFNIIFSSFYLPFSTYLFYFVIFLSVHLSVKYDYINLAVNLI